MKLIFPVVFCVCFFQIAYGGGDEDEEDTNPHMNPFALILPEHIQEWTPTNVLISKWLSETKDYKILRLQIWSSPLQKKRRYKKLIQYWHPDKHRSTGDPERIAICDEISRKLTKVNEELEKKYSREIETALEEERIKKQQEEEWQAYMQQQKSAREQVIQEQTQSKSNDYADEVATDMRGLNVKDDNEYKTMQENARKEQEKRTFEHDFVYEKTMEQSSPTIAVTLIMKAFQSFDSSKAIQLLVDNDFDSASRAYLMNSKSYPRSQACWIALIEEWFDLVDASPDFVSPRVRFRQAVDMQKFKIARHLFIVFGHRPVADICQKVILFGDNDLFDALYARNWIQQSLENSPTRLLTDYFTERHFTRGSYEPVKRFLRLGANPNANKFMFLKYAKSTDNDVLFKIMIDAGGRPDFEAVEQREKSQKDARTSRFDWFL
jgi:hypothetical protein